MSEIPVVASPYEGRKLLTREHLVISAFWFATNFLWGSMISLFIPKAMDRLAKEHAAETTGLLVSMGALVALIVPLLAGALSDRCTSPWGRRRPYMIRGVLISFVGMLLMGLALTGHDALGEAKTDIDIGRLALWMFFFGYLLLDVGINIAAAAFAGIIPDLVPADQRGTASGFMSLLTFGGVVSGVIIVSTLLNKGYVLAALGSIAGIIALMLSITILGVKETPLTDCGPPLRFGPYLKSLWISPRQYPDFAWVWITRALVMFGAYAVQPYLIYYLRDAIAVPYDEAEKVAGMTLAALVIGAAASAFVSGRLSDKIGRKRIVYAANTFMALMAFGLAFASSLPVVMVIGALFGLGFGAYSSVDWALGTDTLPNKSHAGKDMAVWHVAQVLPQSIAAAGGGFLLAGFGKAQATSPKGAEYTQYDPTGYTVLFCISASFLLLGAVLLRNVRGVK